MDFKYLFKVNAEHPEIALRCLGLKIANDANAFKGVELDFVRNQEFITAVPVEIALTVGARAELLFKYPDLKFIVTGVPAQRIAHLVDYGYEVYAILNDKEYTAFYDHWYESTRPESVNEEDKITLHPSDEEPVNEGGPSEPVDEAGPSEDCQKEEAKEENGDPKPEYRFWINGEEVSKEEFDEAVKKLEVDPEIKKFSDLQTKDLLKTFFSTIA